MILTFEETKKLLNNSEFYECELIKQRFAWDFFQEQLSPFGNILIFDYPTKIGKIDFKRSLNVCIELPNYNQIAGVCFERLFLTQIGSILADETQTDCFVNENTLIVNDKQASITLLNTLNNSVLLQITLPLKGIEENFHYFENASSDMYEKIKNSFYFLTKSIFLESQYNNI